MTAIYGIMQDQFPARWPFLACIVNHTLAATGCSGIALVHSDIGNYNLGTHYLHSYDLVILFIHEKYLLNLVEILLGSLDSHTTVLNYGI